MFKNSKKLFPKNFLSFEGSKFFRITFQLTQLVGRYPIKVDNLTIPLSVSYNTGGIKLNEVATSVGLGWSLNIPGYINHTVIFPKNKNI